MNQSHFDSIGKAWSRGDPFRRRLLGGLVSGALDDAGATERSIAHDRNGASFVTDSSNHRVLRFDPA